MPGGGLGVIWVDGRAVELDTTSPEGGAFSIQFASFSPEWKQTAEMLVDDRACECCHTSAAVTSDGIVAAFRDRSDKEIRDTYVSRFENGKWTPPAPVHADGWEIYACPVNGPSISARGRDVAVAWFTAKNDRAQAYAAFSTDGGRSWGSPIRLDDNTGINGRVDIELLDDGSAVATWLERGRFQMRRVDRNGGKSPTLTVAGGPDSLAGGHPRVARSGNELVFAWTASAGAGAGESETSQKVETAVVRLP
jgi:hypothetical protein